MSPVLSVIGFGEPVTLTTRKSTFAANSAAGADASAARTTIRSNFDMNLSLDFGIPIVWTWNAPARMGVTAFLAECEAANCTALPQINVYSGTSKRSLQIRFAYRHQW